MQRIKEDYLTDVDWTFGVNALLRRRSMFDGIPREVALNDAEANKVKGYENNSVSTGKYGPITFLPKFLYCASDLQVIHPSEAADDTRSRALEVRKLVLPVHW